MNNLFDFLSSSNMVAYWLEKHVNDQPLLGETLFPVKKEMWPPSECVCKGRSDVLWVLLMGQKLYL